MFFVPSEFLCAVKVVGLYLFSFTIVNLIHIRNRVQGFLLFRIIMRVSVIISG